MDEMIEQIVERFAQWLPTVVPRPTFKAELRADLELLVRRAAEAASPAAGWRPIASAPKDGTFLLLFARCKTATAAIPVLGSFCDDEWQELAFTPNYPVGIVPTHWMPRPDWPSPSEEARAG